MTNGESREKAEARSRMVERQLRSRDIHDDRVLEAMKSVPRHRFVPPEYQRSAYSDGPLPIGEGQTISQPYIVAYMTQLLELEPDDHVLEIGTGSGYQAAVLGHIAGEVYSVERVRSLAQQARQKLEDLGYGNIHVVQRDGSGGLPEHAPYDAIIVTAAAPDAPDPLKEQLADGGRLVVPVGSRGGQILERWTRRGDEVERERLAPVAFVPLLGDHGWEGDSSDARGLGWF
ncbi:MAG: protein-L-isoaspartate(D-aspartate) O-methyltransferase [Anaerolineales bacterium]|nr:protein-L-isoaspartate(D-aspartate) O-methyltransferase [Anaerolineales bacterium]